MGLRPQQGGLSSILLHSFWNCSTRDSVHVCGVPYFIFEPAYRVLQYPFESILNSIGIYFFIGWFIGFLPMTVVITEKEEIESFAAFFLGSFFTGVVLISLITGLFWGLMLSVIGVVIMYLIKVFSEHNELW